MASEVRIFSVNNRPHRVARMRLELPGRSTENRWVLLPTTRDGREVDLKNGWPVDIEEQHQSIRNRIDVEIALQRHGKPVTNIMMAEAVMRDVEEEPA